MPTLLTQPVFQLYAVCSALLVLIMYLLAFSTAKTRATKKKILNSEDVKVNSGAQLVESEDPTVQRIKRAHQNAIENSVPFFVIAFLFALSAPSMAFAQGLFIGFVVLRVLHAVFYLNAIQPFRTLAFGLGALINLTMAVQVFRAAITS